MSNQHDDVIPDSTYAVLLAPPEFKSEIPEYLLKDASDQEKHIMAALSVGAQYDKWLVRALVETHAQVRLTNGKVRKHTEQIEGLQGESETVKTSWKAIAKVASGIVAAVSVLWAVWQALHGS